MMRLYTAFLMLILLQFTIPMSNTMADNLLTAAAILKKVDSNLFPESFEMRMTMVNYDRKNHVKSRFTMLIKTKAEAGSLMLIEEPKRERGQKILQKKNNIWMSTPGNSKTIKLANSADFMGSTFSNNDLMDSTLQDDYKATIVEKKGLPKSVILLRLTAKRKTVSYARIDLYVRSDSYIPVITEYYSKSGVVLKTMSMSNIKNMAGRNRPTKMVMKDAFKKGAATVVEIKYLLAKKSFPASMFNEARMTN